MKISLKKTLFQKRISAFAPASSMNSCSLLKKDILIHINVPTPTSFHRQLAWENCLIDSVCQFSQRFTDLLQCHIINRDSLRGLLNYVDFEILEEGGYFVKSFTNWQMASIIQLVTELVLEGLWNMGRKYPELAGEKFANVEQRAK